MMIGRLQAGIKLLKEELLSGGGKTTTVRLL